MKTSFFILLPLWIIFLSSCKSPEQEKTGTAVTKQKEINTCSFRGDCKILKVTLTTDSMICRGYIQAQYIPFIHPDLMTDSRYLLNSIRNFPDFQHYVICYDFIIPVETDLFFDEDAVGTVYYLSLNHSDTLKTGQITNIELTDCYNCISGVSVPSILEKSDNNWITAGYKRSEIIEGEECTYTILFYSGEDQGSDLRYQDLMNTLESAEKMNYNELVKNLRKNKIIVITNYND